MTKQELINKRDRVKEEISAYESWMNTKFDLEKGKLLKEENFSGITVLEKKHSDCKVLLEKCKIQLNDLETEIGSLKDINDQSPPSLDDQSKILSGSGGGGLVRRKDTGTTRRPFDYSTEDREIHLKNKKESDDVKEYINKVLNKKNK